MVQLISRIAGIVYCTTTGTKLFKKVTMSLRSSYLGTLLMLSGVQHLFSLLRLGTRYNVQKSELIPFPPAILGTNITITLCTERDQTSLLRTDMLGILSASNKIQNL